jgi:hypothetical protein
MNGKRLELFQSYVEKYKEIVPSHELKWWLSALKGDSLPQEKMEECEIKMVDYLNLVWEEYHLLNQKLISKKLWNVWKPNIIEVVETEFAKKVMKKYDFEFILSYLDLDS